MEGAVHRFSALGALLSCWGWGAGTERCQVNPLAVRVLQPEVVNVTPLSGSRGEKAYLKLVGDELQHPFENPFFLYCW